MIYSKREIKIMSCACCKKQKETSSEIRQNDERNKRKKINIRKKFEIYGVRMEKIRTICEKIVKAGFCEKS